MHRTITASAFAILVVACLSLFVSPHIGADAGGAAESDRAIRLINDMVKKNTVTIILAHTPSDLSAAGVSQVKDCIDIGGHRFLVVDTISGDQRLININAISQVIAEKRTSEGSKKD